VKTIYVGLGSNLGDKVANFQTALQSLPEEIKVTRRSRMQESEPMYVTNQPKFLNMVIEATTRLSAQEVFRKIKSIEKEMGEHEHNQPRVIDIDLLFYGNESIETPELTVPHPKIAERRFVLEPMVEIAPRFIHPTLNVSIAELLKRV
jgi:2-amino-4-hydroxy-6-hydroxymethyldihydropteridine diphosphokinase